MSERRKTSAVLPGRRLEPGEVPTLPGDQFVCESTHCRLTADACCHRQLWKKPGTPEPFFPYCHRRCPQGTNVRKAMPPDYTPRPPPWAFRGRGDPKRWRGKPDED